jgi:sugar lactone lactonase YvrE
MVSEVLAEGGFFECPRWHAGKWWVSDFYARMVLSVSVDGRTEPAVAVDGQPGGLGWLPDGSLLIASMRERRILRCSPVGTLTELVDLTGLVGGDLNELVVDRRGRGWVGNFGYDVFGEPARSANLIRFDREGTASVAATGLDLPNGMVLSEDGATLIVGESAGSRYTAFTVTDEGALVDRRVWADLTASGIAPDGCCLDAEGRIWAADVRGNRLVRLAEGGAVLQELRPPEGLHVYACMLGGRERRTLSVCASPGYRQESDREGAGPGVLLVTEVSVPGAGTP